MKWEVKPATLPAIEYVVRHLAGRNRREIDAMNLSRYDALAMAIAWLAAGDCEGVVHIDDNPACTLGFDGNYTWFLATEAFYDAGVRAIVAARRYLKKTAESRTIMVISLSDHPDAERWFEVLGFEKVEKTAFSTIYRFGVTSPPEQAI